MEEIIKKRISETMKRKGIRPLFPNKLAWNKGKKYKNPKISEIQKGRKLSEETKEKIRKSHLGMKYKPMSEIGKKNISNSHKGKKLSEETKNKLSEIRKGIKHTLEWNRKVGLAHKGEKAWNWKGGISRNKQGNTENIKWRILIFQRDNFTCCFCHKVGGELESHHIKSWAKYPELRYKLDNGITLCRECHKLTNNYGGKK